LCIGKCVSGQTCHLFWDRGSTPQRKMVHFDSVPQNEKRDSG
jgi:hypothetical protein